MAVTRVGARLLSPLIAYLQAREVDVASLMARVGLDEHALDDPDTRIDAQRAVRLFDEAERVLGDPLIGLHIGATVTRESFDLLSQATFASRTIREMGERLARFIPMAVPGPVYTLRETGDRAWWIIGDVFPSGHCVRHLCELTLSLGVSAMRQQTQSFAAPLRVHFDHAPAAEVVAYERVFAAPVIFGQHESGFEIPAAILDEPLARADPGLARVLDRYAEDTVRKLPNDADVLEQARMALSAALERGGAPDLPQLSKRLATSTRSLQRLLRTQGTSFQQLLDQERHKTALRLLQQSGVSITQAAEHLGFSDVAAFRRAFRRWTGESPRAYLSKRE